MHKKLSLAILTILLTMTCQSPSWAGKVLDKIKETGVITAGTRNDAIPFAYMNNQGKWVGYSIDILERIRSEAEKQLGKPIKLQLVAITPENRFSKIQDHSIDIECSSTTFTWEREKKVDFSVSYFASGTQMLVKKGSGIGSLESLAGRRIGVMPKTTNEAAIKSLQPEAQLIIVQDQIEGFSKLQKGEIDGFASDGILLEGLRIKAANPQDFEVVPEYPYQYESYACMLPQDESAWRDLVNYSLIKFMEGIVSDQNKSVTIYERWFGTEGLAPYPRETINDYFQGIVDGYEWIPVTD